MSKKIDAEIRKVLVDEVVISGDNPREDFDEDKIELLGKSMEEFTQLAPIIINEVNGELQLVAGERRLRAAMAAGQETIEAKVFQGLTRLQAIKITLAENRDRVSLNVIEQARGYALLLEEGVTLREVAAAEHLTVETIEQRLELLDLPEDVRELIVRENHPLPIYMALQINRMVPAEQRGEVARKTVRSVGPVMHKDEFKEMIDSFRGPKLDIPDPEDEDGEGEKVEVESYQRSKPGKPGQQVANSKQQPAASKQQTVSSKPGPAGEYVRVDARCGLSGKLEYLTDVDIVMLVDPIISLSVNGETVLFQAAMLTLPVTAEKLEEVKAFCKVKKAGKVVAKKAVKKKEVEPEEDGD